MDLGLCIVGGDGSAAPARTLVERQQVYRVAPRTHDNWTVVIDADRDVVRVPRPRLDEFHDSIAQGKTRIEIVVDHHMLTGSQRVPLEAEHQRTALDSCGMPISDPPAGRCSWAGCSVAPQPSRVTLPRGRNIDLDARGMLVLLACQGATRVRSNA